MVKLIACDCDGTILNSKKEIPKNTLNLIKSYLEKDNYFVLCSGRPYYRVVRFLENLGLKEENQYYIGFNGALICNGSGTKIISSNTLTREAVNKIVHFAKQNNICVSIYTYDTVYTENVSDYIEQEGIYKGVNVFLCSDLINQQIIEPIYKVLFADYPDKISMIRKKITNEYFNKYSIVSSAPHYLEFMNIKTSKGNALKELSAYLGIDIDETMAIGDAENDISMLSATKNSVAMGNSSKEIKSICKYSTLTNDEEGVGCIIDKLLKGEICDEF